MGVLFEETNLALFQGELLFLKVMFPRAIFTPVGDFDVEPSSTFDFLLFLSPLALFRTAQFEHGDNETGDGCHEWRRCLEKVNT
jgi:hypothetical protein